MAMFQSPNTSLIMSTVERSQTGVAGSINALARNLGMVFGISLSTVLLYNIMSGHLGNFSIEKTAATITATAACYSHIFLFFAFCLIKGESKLFPSVQTVETRRAKE